MAMTQRFVQHLSPLSWGIDPTIILFVAIGAAAMVVLFSILALRQRTREQADQESPAPPTSPFSRAAEAAPPAPSPAPAPREPAAEAAAPAAQGAPADGESEVAETPAAPGDGEGGSGAEGEEDSEEDSDGGWDEDATVVKEPDWEMLAELEYPNTPDEAVLTPAGEEPAARVTPLEETLPGEDTPDDRHTAPTPALGLDLEVDDDEPTLIGDIDDIDDVEDVARHEGGAGALREEPPAASRQPPGAPPPTAAANAPAEDAAPIKQTFSWMETTMKSMEATEKKVSRDRQKDAERYRNRKLATLGAMLSPSSEEEDGEPDAPGESKDDAAEEDA